MSFLEAGDDLAAYSARMSAAVKIEQRLLGRVLRVDPGASNFAAQTMRRDSPQFLPPHDRLMAAIYREMDAGRTVTPSILAAEMPELDKEIDVGIFEYLWSIAQSAPTTISPDDTHKQMQADFRAWQRLQMPLPKAGDVELVSADTIQMTNIEWLWPGWLAAGKFHLIAGSPGTGKTTLSLAIAATLTSAGVFPCGARAPLASVLMWTGEDDPADSIVPRFVACGGDKTRLRLIAGVRDEDGRSRPFDPAYDVDRLIASARRIEDLKLLIVDPLVSAVTGDGHKNSETRRALQPLVDFACNAGVAVLGVTHYSKGTSGRDPSERVTGSLAFVAVPRLVMATAKSKEPAEPWRLVRAKSNIGPDGGGFEYELRQVPVDQERAVSGQCVVWGEKLEGDAKTLLAEIETPNESGNTSALDSAKAWLAEILGTGIVAVNYLQDSACEKGHAWATVQRAKKALGVESLKTGTNGGWSWQMPKAEHAQTNI